MEFPSFQHISAALRVFSGEDSLRQLGRELDRVGSSRAVIVCGSTLARGPLLGLVQAAMGERCAGVFSGVRAHSPRPAVEAAASALKRLEADAVVALGGGSAIVTARAASILLAEGAELDTLSTSRDEQGRFRSPKLLAPKLPQLIVLTTPTTAAVKAGTAVFDPASRRRFALFDPKTRALSLFIHPELMRSAPRALVVSAGLDTLSLSLEGLMSRAGDPISDALLIHAVRLLASRLPDQGLDDASIRADLVMAAVLAGRGTDHAGGGVATVLGHAIGANHEVANGVVKSILVPHALRFNAEAAGAGLRKTATALGVTADGPGMLEQIEGALNRIAAAVGTPRRLRDIGVGREHLPEIAARGMGDFFLNQNPRPVRDATELQDLLEHAW